jgi:heptosyltransferase-2
MLIACIVQANKRIGFNKTGNSFYDSGIPGSGQNEGLHYTKRCFNALKPLGISPPDPLPLPELYPPDPSEQFAEQYILENTSKPVVVLNISASMERKMWSNDNWQKVVENCSELREYEIILSHAPEEKNRALELAGNCKLLKLYPSRNFFDVISLIKRSKLLLTPDTAMVHVAAAFDKPLVGLFSGLDDFYAKFHPLSSNYIDVHSPKGFDGVAGIKPESVIEAIKKILHNFPFDLEH